MSNGKYCKFAEGRGKKGGWGGKRIFWGDVGHPCNNCTWTAISAEEQQEWHARVEVVFPLVESLVLLADEVSLVDVKCGLFQSTRV